MIRLSIDRFRSLSKIVVHGRWLSILIFTILLLGCRPIPSERNSTIEDGVDASPSDLFYAEAEIAIPALIETERLGSIEGDLDTLRNLWTKDARIIDGRTTAALEDDYLWSGRDAILDRYVVAVFPNPPPPFAKPLQPEITVDDDETRVNYGVDQWRFVHMDGRWWIDELVYQRP